MSARRRFTILLVAAAALFGLSQIALVGGARRAALEKWDSVKGAGLASNCMPEEVAVAWVGPNRFVVRISQDCGPKAGEGLSVRLHWGPGGWTIDETFAHWVV